ncbi:hypothetical protein [Actinomadura sp. RB99]|uniref:hypothetical protein n=1 Tax=Actinomadura sp. RB99 TaxID=2691577 RepID=UPI001683BF63|nr:hypothetical protein [Actinomadura sp. RB99]
MADQERASLPRPGLGCVAVVAVVLALAYVLPQRLKSDGNKADAPSVPSASATAPSAPAAIAPAPTATPHGGLPDPKTVDRGDATAVSRAAVKVMWTVDAATDRSQLDAYLRAKPYLSPEYAERVNAEPAGAVPSLWRDHRAYARVHLTRQAPEDGIGADTAATAHRQWGVTVTPTGRDGWTGKPVHAIAFVSLIRRDGGWQVSGVTTA